MYLVYILCPSQETFDEAVIDFKDHAWAKPIIIPTTFYLEGVMYSHILKRRQHEWEHAEFVGTLSHSAVKKLRDVSNVVKTLKEASSAGDVDVAAFLYRGDKLLAAAERWHPGFLRLWVGTLRYLGFSADIIMDETTPGYYCNYWAAKPSVMKEYMCFFKVFTRALDTLPVISDEVWNDSGYSGRGLDVARLTPDQCMKIWGVEYYPFHPFLLERLPCFYFYTRGKKLIVSSC
jgi:hypothetical protein